MSYSIFSDTMVDMTYKQIEEAGKKNAIVLFPIAVIEEHGPHMCLGTDTYLTYDFCRKLKKELVNYNVDSLIAPPFYWGVNSITDSFPGSFSVRPETMVTILMELLENLRVWGFNNTDLVDVKEAGNLKSSNITEKELKSWLKGGRAAREITPLGYCGNPSEINIEKAAKLENVLLESFAKHMYEFIIGK